MNVQSAVKLLSRSASYSGALRTCPARPFRSMRTHRPPHRTVWLGAVLERSLPYVTRATSRSLTISSNGRLLVTGVFCGTFLCSILSVIFVSKPRILLPRIMFTPCRMSPHHRSIHVPPQSRSSVRPAVVLLLLAYYYYYRHERKWWGDNEPRPSPYHSLRLNLAVKFT